MFENLTDRLQRVFKTLRGEGRITDEHLAAALGQIRDALLEADVNVAVADDLLARIREKSLGAEGMTKLSPDQQIFKLGRENRKSQRRNSITIPLFLMPPSL